MTNEQKYPLDDARENARDDAKANLRRYKMLEPLGEGGMGTTYKAIDLETDQLVAVKVISLRQISGWKAIELFQREVRVLRQLNHPAIPKYLDSFEIDSPTDRLFYIVQALAPGQTLAQQIQQGWQPDQAAVQAIAVQLLEILIYLQKLTPPILHRDIKPQNLLRDEQGQIYLVDFGAVQDTYRQTVTGGSTVVGTLGYMAPEQFRGQANLATDLYGLGATLVFLLTGQDPIDLPQTADLKFNLAECLAMKLDQDFKDWLNRLLEPAAERRFISAESALLALQGQAQPFAGVAYRPAKTQVSLLKTDDSLSIQFLASGSQALRLKLELAVCFTGYLAFLAVLWLFSSAKLNPFWEDALDYSQLSVSISFGISFLSFAAICFGAVYIIRTIQMLQRPTLLLLNQNQVQIAGVLHPLEFYQTANFRLNWIQDIYLRSGWRTYCVLKTWNRTFRFGHYLTLAEQRWLVQEIQDFIHHQMQVQNLCPIGNSKGQSFI